MTTFVATKFNADTDPTRPKIGDIVDRDGKKFEIKKVDWKEGKDVMRMVMSGEEMDKEGYQDVLFNQHPDRPFVCWIVWVNEVN